MKLKTIDNLKENKIEFYLCKICGQIVDRNHFDTQEHIDKFNDVCKIDIKKCFENVFLTINCKLLDMKYNYSRHKNNCLSCREMSVFARYKSQNE